MRIYNLTNFAHSLNAALGSGCGEAIATYEQLAQRLEELERVDRELGLNDPERIKRRRIIRELLDRGRSAAEIDQMIENTREN